MGGCGCKGLKTGRFGFEKSTACSRVLVDELEDDVWERPVSRKTVGCPRIEEVKLSWRAKGQ
jgi:hypothetical protein